MRSIVPRKVLKQPLVRISGISAVVLIVLHLVLRLTPYHDLQQFMKRPYSTRIYDRNGNLLQITPIENGLRREYVSLHTIKPELTDIFLQAEDARFYYHLGIDGIAIVRAAFQNWIASHNVSGASTITMQLARIIANSNPHPRQHTDLSRKLGEAFNALRLEARLSKKQILELYLNSAPFGFQTEGIASAARNFFAEDITMLSPAQMFCLAVIPRRPAAYNPLEKQSECMEAALKLSGKLSKNKRLVKKYPALSDPSKEDFFFALAHARRFDYPYEMPHLVRYMLSRQNTQDYFNSPSDITLSADIYVQHFVEDLIAANVTRYRSQRITNGSALVLENKTGSIIAWVGSADFFQAQDAGQVDGVLALNQPGSSMKPFLYALALENGFKPSDVIADIPMNFGSDAIYVPQNFNNRFNGPMMLRYALASSLNIPAVYLLYELHQKTYVDFLVDLGFDSLTKNNRAAEAGLGLALGNAPVSIAELAHAFSIFPNDGALMPLRYTLYNTAPQDKKNTPPSPKPEQKISAETARLICSFLSDADARYLAFGRAATFHTTFPVIFKTGTANQYQSIVALGATPQYTIAVWMGNFSGDTVVGKTGSSVPAAIARDTLTFLYDFMGHNDGEENFAEPETFTKTNVCAVSGMAASEACRVLVSEYIHPSAQNPLCTWHYFENDNVVAVRYPAEYEPWLLASRKSGTIDHGGSPLAIVTPRSGFIFFANAIEDIRAAAETIPVEVTGGQEDKLHVMYDKRRMMVERPFQFYLPVEQGTHTLTVQNGDEIETVNFSVE
ncbi:MAG: penicillin-binding protein 1C [Termitinemataceae bacterium]|nr:MAG: penicillin-binding protein 1C [Termitinemataceae bacterium]